MNSCRSSFFIISLLVCGVGLSGISHADTHIEITSPMTPPGWALQEREVLKANSEACKTLADKYLDARGYLLHVSRWGTLDGTDDAIETFRNWTILHSLGASDSVLELFKKGLEGHYRQYKETTTDSTEIAKYGCYYKEFMPMSDWHHQGEGMQGLMNMGLSEPTNILFQERIRRFAGFYMNEDPDAPNYDPVHKVIRSMWTGSRGPMLRNATMYDWAGDPNKGRYNILHSAAGRNEMLDFMKAWPEMLAHFPEYLHSTGDHPLNLITTQLHLNAYALAHEKKYKDWIVEYVDAWADRIDRNGGNIPSNIGLDGTIGGETDGKWYGGTYGWDFSPWSPEGKVVAHRNMFTKGMFPGFGIALLITGDQKYVDVLRRQIDNIYAQKKIVNGREVFPQNYGEKAEKTECPIIQTVKGITVVKERKLTEPQWYNFTTNAYISQCMDIYLWSMDRRDLERIPKTGWIGFLEGQNSGYPEEALRRELSGIRNDMEDMRNDPTTPDTRLADWIMDFNPYSPTHTLVSLMNGGYFSEIIYVPHYRVRYFDPERRRAGIPEDVASLVTEISKEMTKVILVNIDPVKPRDVIVQTGAYGEHQCVRVEVEGKSYPVNHRFFSVRLAPGAGAELVIYANRYTNEPTLAFPWHGDTVPLP